MGKKFFLSILLFLCVQMVSTEVIGDLNDDNVIELSEVIDLIIGWESHTCLSDFIKADRFREFYIPIPVRPNDVTIAISIWANESIIEPIGEDGIKVVFAIPKDDNKKNNGVARLYFTDMNKFDLYLKACWYAGEIIGMAEAMDYKVNKTQANMAWEIRCHVALYEYRSRQHPFLSYRFFVDHSLPIDIELNTGRWEGAFPDIDWEIIEFPCI
jgi:hypothetical protein